MENNNFQLEEKEEILNEVETFWAFTSYIIFFLPLLGKFKTSEFVRFHMRQGFSLFIFFMIAYTLGLFLPWAFLKVILYIIVFIWWCFGVTFVLLGKKRSLPLFGWIAQKIL